jgi:hypothetical protein
LALGSKVSQRSISAFKLWGCLDPRGFNGGGLIDLYQSISTIGRALPQRSPRRRDFIKLQRRLTNPERGPDSVSPEILKEIRSWVGSLPFGANFASKFRDSVSCSASYLSDVKSGGLSATIKKLSDSYGPRVSKDYHYHVSRNSPVEMVSAAQEKIVATIALHGCINGIARAKAVGVPERGWKTRLITKSDDLLNLGCKPFCNAVFGIISKVPSCKGSFMDDMKHIENITQFISRRSYMSILSTDLSESTDNIPLVAAVAVIEGMYDGTPDFENKDIVFSALRRMVGPWTIETPLGSFVTTNGVLMGTPISFVILSLLHAFSMRKARVKGGIKGDDAVVPYISTRQRDDYRFWVNKLVAPSNLRKEFDSPRGFVFLERLVTGTRICLVPPCRQLLVVEGQSLDPLEACRLPVTLYRRLSGATCIINAKRIVKLFKKGVFPYLPRVLGGAGFLPYGKEYRPLKTVPCWTRQLIQHIAYELPDDEMVVLLTRIYFSLTRQRDRVDFASAEKYALSMSSLLEDSDNENSQTAVTFEFAIKELISSHISLTLKVRGVKTAKTFNAPMRRMHALFSEVKPNCGIASSILDVLLCIRSRSSRKVEPLPYGIPKFPGYKNVRLTKGQAESSIEYLRDNFGVDVQSYFDAIAKE